MSPHEQGDILIESERVATSGGDFSMYQGRGGVCQSRRAALLDRAPDPALEETSSRTRGGASGTRQSRPAYPAPPSGAYARPLSCISLPPPLPVPTTFISSHILPLPHV